MPELLHRLCERGLDLVYPRDCEHCGESVDDVSPWSYLCADCASRVDWIRGPACETCGHPFPGIVSGQSCEHCEAIDPVFQSGRCCVLHREVGASIVRGLKYRGARYLAKDMSRMAADLPEVVEHVRGAVLVPVPLHPARERWRGFNQSALLAKAFARELSVAGCAGLLERARNTATQTRLTREERLRNMRNAFALKAGAELRADLTYIVVDDVFTTGSTLNECCRVLRRSGAKTLKVLTFAHG